MYIVQSKYSAVRIGYKSFPQLTIALLVDKPIDGFQMPIKRPTSARQVHDQGAAVHQTFHLVRSSFCYLSALMVKSQRGAY